MLSNSQQLAERAIRLVGLILQSLGKQHLKVNVSEKGVLVGLHDCVALVNSNKGLLKGQVIFFFFKLSLPVIGQKIILHLCRFD